MRRTRTGILILLAATAPHALGWAASAQRPVIAPTAADSAAAFANAATAELFGRARDARVRNDSSIRSYTAVVRSRVAAGVRMPLKDRTIFRKETAARVRWSRDSDHIVQVLGARSQHPGGVETHPDYSGLGLDDLFDPSEDRLYFGLGGSSRDTARSNERRRRRNATADSAVVTDSLASADVTESSDSARGDSDSAEFWIEHPLGDAAERHYRFQIGDTLTIQLQDAREVRVIELRVTPQRDDPHTVRGALWIDAASGSLVQAAFRLARVVNVLRDMEFTDEDDRNDMNRIPGFLKPIEFDASLMTVEYSLWEMSHWLPRTMRVEGMARAGVLTFPASFDVSYDMQSVDIATDTLAEADLVRTVADEWLAAADAHQARDHKHAGRNIVMIVPTDSMRLLESELLPPPIWTDAPGFATSEELSSLTDRLASLGGAIHSQAPPHFGWGFGEGDMLRYNRVEALSIGARASVGLRNVDLSGTVRLGIGDLNPNIDLRVGRETMRRTLELRAYHELATVDPTRAALKLGNSISSLLFGRDAGEYYRASGGAITWSPPTSRRRTWEIVGYAEYQNDVERETDFALPRIWSDSVFRSNIVAAEGMQYGSQLRFRPWWGTDPASAQFGLDLQVRGETGKYQLASGSVALRAAAPLTQRMRIGAEAEVGSGVGDVTPQRMFYLGGARTLRGYDPSTVAGVSMARGRLELARTASFGSVALFSDWGWAGDRDAIRAADQLWSVGTGFSLLDGLVRLDLARGLRGTKAWRLDLHMDAIL